MITENLNCTNHKWSGGGFTTMLHAITFSQVVASQQKPELCGPYVKQEGFYPIHFSLLFICYEYSCLLPYQDFNSRVHIRSGGGLFPSVIFTPFHFPTRTSRVEYP